MRILHQNPKIFLLLAFIATALSCSKADDSDDNNNGNPEATSINEYIQGLTYDPSGMLNVNNIGGNGYQLNLLNQEVSEGWPFRGNKIKCTSTDYKLERDFDETAILRYTGETIYPGALVNINQEMLNGLPDSLQIDRRPINLMLDLPNMGDNGNISIENPAFIGNVETGIDNALSWWNNNAYVENHVSESFYRASKSYTTSQIGLELGLPQQWSNQAYSNEFIQQTTPSQRVAYMAIKKVFYSVNVDEPTSPSNFFANDVTLEEVQSKMDDDNPPAYISSVQYGKIFLLRISSYLDTNVGLDEVLNYIAGNTEIVGVNNEIETIIDNSVISVITIDENAEVSTETINFNTLLPGPGSISYLTEEGSAVYAPTNPGIPIAYQTRYIKDNALVKTGYTTNYNSTYCSEDGPYIHDDVTVTNESFHDTRFYMSYLPQNSTSGITFTQNYEINQGDDISVSVPDGVHDIRIYFQYQYGAGGWNAIYVNSDNEVEYRNYIYSEICYEFDGGNIWGAPSEVYWISCN
ncbi:thiol-activated cytolysin family protein [uncultured Psychroserpens sp.]|uniref:thiol-activated cytolysin family protein n=1 Tax=uncultured Psychroserpens sp. TaxID=255436 RepID=UPI002627296F|nr:thiol-activated cytolysin family protein [uncultured Psychroserpens sp.]